MYCSWVSLPTIYPGFRQDVCTVSHHLLPKKVKQMDGSSLLYNLRHRITVRVQRAFGPSVHTSPVRFRQPGIMLRQLNWFERTTYNRESAGSIPARSTSGEWLTPPLFIVACGNMTPRKYLLSLDSPAGFMVFRRGTVETVGAAGVSYIYRDADWLVIQQEHIGRPCCKRGFLIVTCVPQKTN